MRKIIGKLKATIALNGAMILLLIVAEVALLKNEVREIDRLIGFVAVSGAGYDIYLMRFRRMMIDKYKKFYFTNRVFSKYRRIFQVDGSKPESECQQILQFFTYHFPVEELPEGWYITVTHDYVIRQLERSKNVHIISVSGILYSEKLNRIRKNLIGKDCGQCQEECSYKHWNKKVDFHLVKFKVEEKRQEL